MQLVGYRLSEVLLRGDFNVTLLRFALQHMSPGASPTTMPSFFGLWRKAVFYQRTTGSSKRITMCSTNIPARTQMQSINSGKGHAYALNLKDSGIEVVAKISLTSLIGRNRSPYANSIEIENRT